MHRLPLIAATAFACAIGTTTALAQERGSHWPGAQRDGTRHHGFGHDGYRHDGYRGHYYGPRFRPAPYAYSYYYNPYVFYPGAPLVYSYPIYEPAPVIVEPAYEPRRFYEATPAEPRYRYEERNYAQVEPAPVPAPAAPSQPATPVPAAPQFERYTLSAKELFGFDEATIRGPQPKLDEIAEAMKRDPRIEHVTITGHTDRIGSDAYNLKLSQRRAEAVKKYLAARGVEDRRLETIGRGKANPVVQCNDKDRGKLIRCLEPNRRVEVEQITIERQVR